MRTAALAAVLVVAASCGGARNAAPSSTALPVPSPIATATSSAAPATATPTAAPGRSIEDVIAQIDEAKLVAHMNALVAVGSRDPRHPGHEKAAQYLRDQLKLVSGIATGLHQTVYQGIPLQNILVTISPTSGAQTSVNGAILICAHYDSTASRTPGWRPAIDPAPGADDDATG